MQMWFFDTEVFSHDWLLVAKRQGDGRTEAFWNDNHGVAEFIAAENPVLCGWNARDYDSHILKATLLDWSPEDIHNVSKTIIDFDDRSMVWALFQGYPWVDLPPIIDVIHDIVPRRSLKAVEGNIGMSIEESSVPFDIDRPLTEAERDEVLLYCIHDVTATEKVYNLRYDYVKAKSDLCEMQGVDPLTMLKHTNARIVSEVLGAVRLERHPIEVYRVPSNLDITAIPDEVLTYVLGVNTRNCIRTSDDAVEFMFHGCPTKFALGGIHAAVPSYVETASETRAILLQDIGSFYPSLIINNGYMSRAVSDPSVYERFYEMRMKAKAEGDKATAEAAKLVLNTTYGTFKDTYNKLFDPMQATRVCLSGQLYILDLVEQMFRATTTLQVIQLNTDGWFISVDRDELDALNAAVAEWKTRTGFTVDTVEVERIVQANVNNYVMRTVDGKIKAKGGVVARHAGRKDPNWWKSNSNTIVDKAVVDYLLDGVPIEKTVNECDDLERFQIIAKAGVTFQKVVHQVYDDALFEYVEVEVQRCNRVYAVQQSELGTDGGIFKVKLENGVETGRQRVPLTPEHCIIDNDNRRKKEGLTTLDRSWYIRLAQKKAWGFIKRDKKERELMADTSETHNEAEAEKPTPTRRTTKKAAQAEVPAERVMPPFRERLLQLQRDMAEVAKTVVFDKVVDKINHEYADTQQYKVWLSAKCSALDLIFGFDLTDSVFLGVINPDAGGAKMYATQIHGRVVISDAHSDEFEVHGVAGLGVNTTAGYTEGGAQTNALRNYILNNYLLDNMGRDGDDVGLNAAEAATESKGYVSPDKKADIKQSIKAEKTAEAQFAPVMFMEALRDKIMEAREIPGAPKFSKIIDTYYEKDGTVKTGENGRSLMPKVDAVAALSKAEEVIAQGTKKDGASE